MLRVEHVRARRRDGRLLLLPLQGGARERALGYARAYVQAARSHLGRRREQLEAAFAALAVAGSDRRLAAGLRKLVEDRCTFEGLEPAEAEALRRALFERAAAARAALSEGEPFDRAAVVAEVAAELGLSAEQLDERLYADLKAEQRLVHFEEVDPEALVEGWDEAQAQAALLRAAQVEAWVQEASPRAYRRLFRKLRFLRLLHRIEPLGEGREGYRIEISGPEGVLRASTRYGPQLAMLLPSVRRCGRWRLRAELLWGRQREPLVLELQGEAEGSDLTDPPLSEDAQDLLERFGEARQGWRCRQAEAVLEVPGEGLLVPDLTFEHLERGVEVHCEVLGYWSREALWRRLELFEEGLAEPVLLCAPARLRVREEAAPEQAPVSLYVYKSRPAVREVLRRLELLAGTRDAVAPGAGGGQGELFAASPDTPGGAD